MKVNKNTNKENTHKESVNLKIKDRTYLDTIEVRKIITLNLGFLSQMIYNHLIEKYIYFFNKNKLNSKEEFFQSYDDIAMGVRGNLSYHLINKGLDELIEQGFITRNLKLPEGAKNNIPKHHYLLNMKILNDIVITPEEYKLPNKKKYEIQQDIKYNHNTALKKKDTPKVEIINDNSNDKTVATTYNSNDDDDSNDELMGVSIEDFEERDGMIETLSNEHTPIVKPIEEIKTAEEPLNEIEIINNNKNDAIMRETDTYNDNTDNNIDDNIELNERAKLILRYKDYEGVKPVLKDLMLSTETLNSLCSDNYKMGLNKKLDDKKETLDILFDVFIKQIMKKEKGER